MAIEKKFKKIGNSWGLVIPNEILALLNINPETNRVLLDSSENTISIKILAPDENHINEKKLVKTSTVYAIIFPQVAFEKILKINPEDDKVFLSLENNKIIVKSIS